MLAVVVVPDEDRRRKRYKRERDEYSDMSDVGKSSTRVKLPRTYKKECT